MLRISTWLLLLTVLHGALAGTILQVGITPLDRTLDVSNPLNEAGAQPSGLLVVVYILGQNMVAGDSFSLTSERAAFSTPSTPFSVIVNSSESSGRSCLMSYVTGTQTSMTLRLSQFQGGCNLIQYTRSNQAYFWFTLPQSVLGSNPSTSSTIRFWLSATNCDQVQTSVSYTDPAIIYAVADPRNADDSASDLDGGDTPTWLRIGFTPTLNLRAGAVITVSAWDSYGNSASIFKRVASASVFPGFLVGSTGCVATYSSSFGSRAVNSLQFTLSNAAGQTCQLSAAVPVNPSQFRIPAVALSPNPVSTTVYVYVTATVNGVTYSNANGNPDSYDTNDGCGVWSSWSACSGTCSGTSSRSRTRTSSTCTESSFQQIGCNTVACGCTPWSSWSSCSATCRGTVSRSRTNSVNCNVPTIETQACGPQDCSCPWTQTNCSSSCGSGVRTRTMSFATTSAAQACGISSGRSRSWDVVCNETFTPEARACQCQDLSPWTDRYGRTCADYANNNWCTNDGTYGAGWPVGDPLFRSFDDRAGTGGETAVGACCACGKQKCVKDTILLLDKSGSIADSDWVKVIRYITDRVNQTAFTNEFGNRIGIARFDEFVTVYCPLTWNQTFLLRCIRSITETPGGYTATSAGLNLAWSMLDAFSSPNRTRVIEMMTDGSPNRPTGTNSANQYDSNNAINAAFTSANFIKSQGVTIITLGMGVACKTDTSTDCLNTRVLNGMSSDPDTSYSVLLSSYDSLTAMSLFLSSQCKPVVAGFDQSPSPPPVPISSPSPIILAPSPFPSGSPPVSPNPSASPFPSPSPDATQRCIAQETLIPKDYVMQSVGGCSKDGVARALTQYQCVELQPGCGTFSCALPVPPAVVQQIQAGC